MDQGEIEQAVALLIGTVFCWDMWGPIVGLTAAFVSYQVWQRVITGDS